MEAMDLPMSEIVNLKRFRKKATRDRHTFVLEACAVGPCRLRYKSAVRAAAKHLDELEVASEEGAVIVAPPSSWLLTPPREDKEARWSPPEVGPAVRRLLAVAPPPAPVYGA